MKNYGLEVELNGKKLCRAGFEEKYFVLSAHLTYVRREMDESEEFYFGVGGLDSVEDVHVDWVSENLELGDVMTFRVIDKDYDMPQIRRNTLSEEEILQNKLKHYYQLQEELKEYLNG